MSAAESTGEVALFDVLALLRAARGLLQEPAGDETAETFDAFLTTHGAPPVITDDGLDEAFGRVLRVVQHVEGVGGLLRPAGRTS